MILESIVTTTNADGSTNVAPMGPIVEEASYETFVLRPFKTSTTYINLDRSHCGVMHITDDVTLFVDGALNTFEKCPELVETTQIKGMRLLDCCRFFEFKVESVDASRERTEISCRIIHQQEIRPFWGFNRAKHALLEMAILATRIQILEADEINEQLTYLRSAVNKTGGLAEKNSLTKLDTYFENHGFDL